MHDMFSEVHDLIAIVLCSKAHYTTADWEVPIRGFAAAVTACWMLPVTRVEG